jgi:DNA-binding transcriptional regulator YhcF (GntR family)
MPRHQNGIPLSIEPRAGEPKLLWVTRNLRNAIENGRLKIGDRLPSHRDLATQWRVSRGIVTIAYEQLQTEGILQTRKGSGTFVADANALVRKSEAPIDLINLKLSPIDRRAAFSGAGDRRNPFPAENMAKKRWQCVRTEPHQSAARQ